MAIELKFRLTSGNKEDVINYLGSQSSGATKVADSSGDSQYDIYHFAGSTLSRTQLS